MDLYIGLTLLAALVHVTSADVIAVAVGSEVIIKDVNDVNRMPCGLPTSYVPTGATFDPHRNILYWVGRRQSWVGVASMDNMGVAKLKRKLYTDIISDGYDIDFDVASGLLYVAAKEGLVVMDTNGTESVQIVRNKHIQNVAVDPIGRHVYWSDFEARVIWRANLDGKNQHAIYFEAETTTSVAIDVAGRRLFWAAEDKIFSSSLNGTDVKSVRVPEKEKIVQVAVKGNSVYYATNWRVLRANKWDVLRGNLNNNPPDVVTRANCMELRTLAVHSQEPIKKDLTKCSLKNGGCYRLCIPLRDGITCASKREILHVPDKMEAPPPQTGDSLDGEVSQTEIDILFDKETAVMRVFFPVICAVVVVLTAAFIVVIVCYWRKVRNEQGKKMIWDVQSISDFRPGINNFSLYMEDDILDDFSLNGRSMKSVQA